MINLLQRLRELDSQKTDEAVRVFHKAPGDDSTSRASKAAVATNPELQKDRDAAATAMKDFRAKVKAKSNDPFFNKDSAMRKAGLSVHNVGSKTVAREGEEFTENLDECGMMPEMGMSMDRPSTPASINMTAGSASELGDLLKDIVSLAGMDKGEPMTPLAVGAPATLEPVGPSMSSMRSVIDKLNGPEDDEDEEKKNVDEYDNTPNDPVKDVDEFDPDQHAHQENQPGQGDRMDGTAPKAYSDVKEAFEDLFVQYKQFVSEN